MEYLEINRQARIQEGGMGAMAPQIEKMPPNTPSEKYFVKDVSLFIFDVLPSNGHPGSAPVNRIQGNMRKKAGNEISNFLYSLPDKYYKLRSGSFHIFDFIFDLRSRELKLHRNEFYQIKSNKIH